MINSLKYAKQLEEAGLTREQAETHMQIITEVMESNLAAKQDVTDLRQEMKDLSTSLKQEIKDLDVRMERRFAANEAKTDLQYQDLSNKMAQIEYRSTIKNGTIATILAGLLLAAIKLL